MSFVEPDIYSFFVSFKNYKGYEFYVDNNFSRMKQDTKCSSFTPDVPISGDETANNICMKFKILYNLIISTKTSPNSKSLDDIDFAYLNYWLNGKLKNNSTSHNLTVEKFQKNMSHIEEEFVHDNFDGKLYDLGEDDYKNMNLLNYLYENYGIIFNNISSNTKEEKISCLQYAHEFIDNYKKCIIQCPLDDTKFCKALKNFKEEYDKIFFTEGSITEKCIDQELLRLTTYKDISVGDKITIVGTILGPSFGTLFASVFLYKFTPFRQWIRAKIRRNQGEDSKLFEENDPSFLDISDNEHISFDQYPYHISYDSVVNS
ncbi:PIR Superfamily Protein [Plasmodium ovale curtisi]|uniref:PIR Superfamily Protein n=1 Tax=Plasmodium ovale curtisi TaxID=864141 RepID=A0A1A8WRV7_PLAOA|nr:PIR Superfamily Protein [Plasmodium ovale curtisi]SBT01152.1 PIR Superfamily Protein [Plasmodium ovale curtisi]